MIEITLEQIVEIAGAAAVSIFYVIAIEDFFPGQRVDRDENISSMIESYLDSVTLKNINILEIVCKVLK
ncbi:hypothetical protein SAMN05660772_02843 [Pasteurella testudinis DSM 23072]|uniref:Uncharacterized protein n=1 Tax=Pasteurella testudinis DSM 23072 TaxID=1122938 RepID=A0A1W1V5P5_9PAST|nr:hypothetical protein [Pasteurella testudinis]SMB88623.1 hypothetical protein SAMN05660772_02843 [Pasteurella testudinis DSM 23072]SUB51582.1 Uncharacterised protein [Pasteurella testudinis]